jgi:polyhydroxyalkanoate synthase subunit PhaC
MGLLPEHPALQHERAPRPLPLFLDLVRRIGESDPEAARAALAGLRAYQDAPRPAGARVCPVISEVRGAQLRDCGGSGPPVVLIPSLINPPRILDLDQETSLASALAAMDRRVLLVDWGPAFRRADLSVAGHVESLLLPLLDATGAPPVLIGYCLGGTMAIAAAAHRPVAGLVTLAAPWNFDGYPAEAREALRGLWTQAEPSARSLGMLPVEILQAAFWSLDEQRTVRKFARFGEMDPASAEARRFVALEEWANQGEPLPYPAARELIDELFGANASGRGCWTVAGQAASAATAVPTLHVTAHNDRIAPSSTAPPGPRLDLAAGHVGMVVGSARTRLHDALAGFLAGAVT